MLRKIVFPVLIICISCVLMPLPYAYADEPDEPDELYADELAVFLNELQIDFKQYLEIMDEFEKSGVYPHYIAENAAGYTWFRQNNPGMSESAAIAYVNVRTDMGAYSRIQEVPDTKSLSLLVNKNHILPRNWEPDDLIHIGSGHRLRDEAAVNFSLMRDDMKESGLNLYVTSSFRSYSRQQNLHRNAIWGQGVAGADAEVAREGHSEHQTGLAVDILHRSSGGSLSGANFQDTDQYLWLTKNAYKYGFILRYPEEFTDIHGYIYEPWHWRYVGADIATAMHDYKIAVYEEFYGKYLAANVLAHVKNLIIEARALAEAEELARLEREALEKQAAEEAALAAEKAALEAEEAKKAAEQSEEILYITMPVSDTTETIPREQMFEKAIITVTLIIATTLIVTWLDIISIKREGAQK